MGLKKYTWRAMRKRPGRAVLTILSIVIGVAAVVAVRITTATTSNAYRQMFATVTGKAALIIDAEGGAAFDESVLQKLTSVPGIRAAVPVVRRYSVLYSGEQRVRLQLMGIDPQRDTMVRDYRVQAGRPVQAGKELMLDEALARRLNVTAGGEVRLLTKRGFRPLPIQVVGVLRLQGASALQNAGLVFVPLRTAQSWYAGAGKIDAIQLVLEPQAAPEVVEAAVAPRLPTGVRVHPPQARTQVMQETLTSSEEGLRFTSACSLLLAGFIILNTFSINVGERRRQLSILRAIGATRRQIIQTVLRESLLLGTVGTVLGIAAGLLAAFYLNRSLSTLLDVQLPPLELSPGPFVIAVLFGLGISVAGALIPAWRAGNVSPLEGMDRVTREDLKSGSKLYVMVGMLIALISSFIIGLAILNVLPTSVAVVAGMFLLVGIVLIAPLFLEPLARLAMLVFGTMSRVESGLALRQILRHRSRSSLTSGVLFVAAATGIGMAHSILDNVRNVRDWYRQALAGDFFIRAMLPDMSTGLSADLPDGLEQDIRKLPHLASIEGASMVESRSGETSLVVIAREQRTETPFDLVAGDRQDIRLRMRQGEVVISSVLAQRLGLSLGDDLKLDTLQGPRKLRICGVTNDYFAGGVTAYLQRDWAVKLLGVEGFDAFLVRAEDGYLESARKDIQALCDNYGVLMHSFTDIGQLIDRMIKGIVGCLWGLVGLGFVVAAFGVVNTLTMSVLEQTRELGLLRIVAMTKRQVRRTILTQALIIGLVGFTPGVLAGVAVAYVLNLAMLPALGRTIPFGFHPWLGLFTLLGALVLTGLAGWIPARRAAELDLVRALHYE